jgi:hypothetical protein
LPKNDIVRRAIQRVRTTIGTPANAESLDRLDIPDDYKLHKGRQFLLADTGAEAGISRILIFGKDSNREWAAQAKHLFIDGTFSLCPPLFSQIIVVLAKRGEYVTPIFYALLPGKSRMVYDTFFKTVKGVG